jgi:N-acetylglutamate synthase-like GNAT family acetyltransferase
VEVGQARESEYEAADALVAGSGLPLDDLDRCRATQYVVRDGAAIVATAALEVRGRDAILRSVAVDPDWRGQRLGERIVSHAIAAAREADLRALYLLTETAADFFPRFGFVVEARAAAPPAIQASAEYGFVCGSHAVPMALYLGELAG